MRPKIEETPSQRGIATLPDGRKLAWSQYGTGAPTLLLIHGWCCDQSFWDNQVRSLAGDFSILTVDMASHGLSSYLPAGSSYSIEALAKDIAIAVEQLDLRDLVIVGHSLGGPVAVEAAIAMPDRSRLVIGIDTFTDAVMYRRRPPEEIAERCKTFRANFPAEVTALIRKITLHDAEGRGVIDWIPATMSAHEPESGVAVLEALLRWDIEARWPLIPCPVTAINSVPVIPLIQHSTDGLTGLNIEMMETVGHFPMLEDPRAFNAKLREVLGRLPPRPTGGR